MDEVSHMAWPFDLGVLLLLVSSGQRPSTRRCIRGDAKNLSAAFG